MRVLKSRGAARRRVGPLHTFRSHATRKSLGEAIRQSGSMKPSEAEYASSRLMDTRPLQQVVESNVRESREQSHANANAASKGAETDAHDYSFTTEQLQSRQTKRDGAAEVGSLPRPQQDGLDSIIHNAVTTKVVISSKRKKEPELGQEVRRNRQTDSQRRHPPSYNQSMNS